MAVDMVQTRPAQYQGRKVLAEYIKPIINRQFSRTVIIYFTK